VIGVFWDIWVGVVDESVLCPKPTSGGTERAFRFAAGKPTVKWGRSARVNLSLDTSYWSDCCPPTSYAVEAKRRLIVHDQPTSVPLIGRLAFGKSVDALAATVIGLRKF
jgi:hypothetical protein